MNIDLIKNAFSVLMGMNGDVYVEEIIETGVLSQRSYDLISDNVSFNGAKSVVEYFGVVQWYYILGKR